MKISTAQELVIYLKENKETFRKVYGITRMGVFGSFVRGEHHVSSDIDIVIEMEKKKKNLHNFL